MKTNAKITVTIRTLKDALGTSHYLLVPIDLAKETVKCHKKQMNPGSYWYHNLVIPTRQASRKKEEMVQIFTGGLSTGEFCNMLHRSTKAEVVFDLI